jgi:predicted ester cyclase
MTNDEAAKLLDKITTAWNANEPDVFDKFWSADFADHGTRGDFGLEALRRMHTSARKSFSDLRVKTEVIFAAGDMVAFRYAFTGTQDGVYRGKAPTGKRFEAWGLNVMRIKGGKITDEWVAFDELSRLQQLDILPEVP